MPDDAPDFLAVHGEAIGRAIRFVCRRAHLKETDAEDVAQDLWVCLLHDSGRRLRRFDGRSAPLTYFIQLAKNALVDIRRRQEGHYRPSACARRLGPVARELEMLIWRDGFTAHEALEITRTHRGATLSDLEPLLDDLQRVRRRCNASTTRAAATPKLRQPLRIPLRERGPSTTDSGANVSASAADPERLLIDAENRRESANIIRLINQAWNLLTPEQRLALARRFASVRRRIPSSSHELQEALTILRGFLTTAGVQSGELLIAYGAAAFDLQSQRLVNLESAVSEPMKLPTRQRREG